MRAPIDEFLPGGGQLHSITGRSGALGRRRLIVAALCALAVLAVPGWGRAAMPAPAATIEGFYGILLAVMKEGRQVPFDQRYARLQPAIARAFNLALMTRIAVGPGWTQYTAGQQQRLETAFARYTIATYTNRFDNYSGERFEVDPDPVANPNGTIVKTRLVPASGRPVSLDYLMRQGADGRWQVIDVYLSGTISELATRRAEFASVLSRKGPDGLVRLLDQRSAALRTG
jgi:phospholipid transport system substrate-binding protein